MAQSIAPPPRFEMRGIRKAFGATVALDDVDLDVRAGEVCALVGQNGAGKSTLMAVLAGALRPDAGSLVLDGIPYAPRDPLAARRAGVMMIYQELSLAPHLSVMENIVLGVEPARFGIVLRPVGSDPIPLLEKIKQVSDVRLRSRDFGLDTVLTDVPRVAHAVDGSCRCRSTSTRSTSTSTGSSAARDSCVIPPRVGARRRPSPPTPCRPRRPVGLEYFPPLPRRREES